MLFHILQGVACSRYMTSTTPFLVLRVRFNLCGYIFYIVLEISFGGLYFCYISVVFDRVKIGAVYYWQASIITSYYFHVLFSLFEQVENECLCFFALQRPVTAECLHSQCSGYLVCMLYTLPSLACRNRTRMCVRYTYTFWIWQSRSRFSCYASDVLLYT